MGKISGKDLAEKYYGFRTPQIRIVADGREMPTGEEIYLTGGEIISSVGMKPDMAVLRYRTSRTARKGAALLEEYLHVGQKMEIEAGYAGTLSRIFLGYLHEVEAEDCMQGYVEYTLLCLDVKGLMKKNSMFQLSGAKKVQQIVKEILGADCYKEFIEKQKVDAMPKEWNPDGALLGETHYDWLCSLASLLNYEFFCGRGEAVFRNARQAQADSIGLSVEYGLQKVQGIVTLAGQTGSIQVCGYNRNDEKVTGTAKWQGAQMPFAEKMKQRLSDFSHILQDMEPETEAQAAQYAKARMERMAGGCAGMKAVTIGIPELYAGSCAEIENSSLKSLSGRIYVEEACHLLQEDGYKTVVQGVRL